MDTRFLLGCATVVLACSGAWIVAACPDEQVLSISCDLQEGYIGNPCDGRDPCNGAEEKVEENEWGSTYNWCTFINEGNGGLALCFTSTPCQYVEPACQPDHSAATEHEKALNTPGGRCGDPECREKEKD